MPTIHISDVRALVQAALQDRSQPIWFPGLAEPLARVGWNELAQGTGLTPNTYGTERLLVRNPEAGRLVVARCSPRPSGRNADSDEAIPVEILTSNVARQIAGDDIRFFDANSVRSITDQKLEEALAFLDLVPTVWPTTRTLVRSLHIIDPVADDTDVSFSDPAMPFSIFVSAPPIWSDVAPLRVAEAVLHEAMHLQLTLVERVVSLVVPGRSMYHSPWRNEPRNPEGILQALYVFAVIRSFLAAIPVRQLPSLNEYLADRLEQIDCQIQQAQGFRECDELTSDGAALVTRLLDIADSKSSLSN